MKKKRQSGRRQQKIEDLTELEVEELMVKDKQWQHYPWICSDCSQVKMKWEEIYLLWARVTEYISL